MRRNILNWTFKKALPISTHIPNLGEDKVPLTPVAVSSNTSYHNVWKLQI